MKQMRNLRAAMLLNDITHEEIANRWKRSTVYVNDRMNARACFSVWEAYDLCRMLEIPISEMPTYFPDKPIKEWRRTSDQN